MTDKFGLGSGHERRQTMNGDIDDGPAPLFISEEENSVVEKKKTVHNSTEKKRKEQIRHWIQQIGEQLPPLVTQKSEKERHGRSTLEIVEKACNYIKELKAKLDNDEELQKVRLELDNMRAERDRLQEILKMAGYAATQETPPPSMAGSGQEPVVDQEQKKKTKKRNTINLQLDLKKQQQAAAAAAAQQQQESQQQQQQQQNAALANGTAGMQDMLAQGIVGNPMTNFPNMMLGGAGQQLINQQMFMNSMMFGVPPAGGSQMPMGGNPCMQAQTPFNQGQTMVGQQSDKNAAEAGAGLLQLAMQDAGITPSSNSNSTQPEESLTTTSGQRSSASDQSMLGSALHTLASVASNTQNVTNVSQIPASQVQSNVSLIQTGTTTTTTQSVNSMAPIMATGQQNMNGTMNMSFGQQQMATNMMQGNQVMNSGTPNAMQQIMFINEQGVPCIANVPVGIDPTSLGLPNMGKQIVGMDKSGNLLIQNMSGQKDDQQALLANTLAQQQMNLAMQGIQQPFQQGQTNVSMGANNMVQQPVNNQLALNQQLMQPMQGSIQGMSNPQNPQGLILPASQTGNLLTVNSVPNFSNPQNQLPQALLLPNGQIIPVVSNPNLFAPGQAPPNQLITPGGQPNAMQQGAGIPQRLPVPQNIMTSDGSQMIVTSTGQFQVSPSSSSTASGTTSLVTTSVITSTVTSTSGVNSNRKVKTSTSASTTSSPEEVLLSQNQANLVQAGIDSSSTVTSQVMTSDPNSASMKILNPQLQSVLHGQLGGSTAPILLTMNCNGQPTSILVDPTTMQVLGTVQTQQPPQQPNLNPSNPVGNSTPSKKNKKNAQRAICPKPQVSSTSSAITAVTSVINPIVGTTVTLPTQANSAVGSGVWNSDKESMEGLPAPSAPVTKKSSSKSKSKSKASKANSENQLEVQTKTDSSGEMEGQDILAKAAESIFSNISPVNFYNPANEDNPLQIDTSVCEGEEDGKESESPKKDASKGKIGATDNSAVLDSDMSETNADDVRSKSKKDYPDPLKEQSPDENDILTNILKAAESNEQEKTSEGGNSSSNQVSESLFDMMSTTTVEPAKKSKKSKKSKAGHNTAEADDASAKNSTAINISEGKSSTQSSKKSNKKSKKNEQENILKETVDEQESLISMPEEITFCENDIEDVLNQVEKMGNSFGSPTGSVSGKKSSKSKKDRSDTADSEPANKKRKKNHSKEKSKEAAPSPQGSSGAKASLSVYDFDEDTDFSTPLFPLHSTRNISGNSNAKNQTTASSSDKTPTSSSSPLFSMPVITTESSSTTPLFEDFPMTPKKRGKHKKNKKAEEKTTENSTSKKSDSDLLDSNCVDRLDPETRVESDRNSSSEVSKKNSDNPMEKMDVEYSSKDNGFFDKTDTRQHSLSFPSEQTNNKTSTSVAFESQVSKEQQMSMSTQNMDTNRQDRTEGNLNSSRRSAMPRSNADPMTNLTVDTNDIESTVNNLLGLSPHMLSPSNQSNLRQKQVQQSPQLQTPKSASPASLKSPMASPAVTYQQQMHISNDHIMSRTSISSSISNNPELSYSAESLFSSQSKHLDSSRSLDTNSSNLQQASKMPAGSDSIIKSSEESSSAVRPKSIYSADNFVQSAKSDKSSKSAPNVISPSMSSNLSRVQNENSSDGFNFNNIGLNLSTPTTSANSFMDSLTMSPIISTIANSTSSSTPFTFTLSSVSSTNTTSTASMMQSSSSQSQNSTHPGNHNFPFYSPHQSPQRPPSHHQRQPTTSASPQHTNSAPNNISSSQPQRPPVNNLSNFDMNLPPASSQMPPSQSSQRRSSRGEHDARMSQHMPTMAESQYSYGMSRNCSVQDQRPREPTSMPREEPPSFPNITVTSHEGPLNMGMSKSNPHKRMNDIGQGSMSSKSNSDSRSDRSSGVGYSMNSNMQPFFPPPNFSNSTSNPLETPPLHHRPILGSDNQSSMGVRGFDPVYSPSQGYNPVQQSFGSNRFESNNMPPFSQRDSGTQPLSHTPPNQVMDGRKSANPPASQTAKANKQPMQGSQSNRTMNGPPSHRSGPTPPQAQPQGSHRPNPQQQLSQPPSQQSRSKSSSSSSRSSSKQSQKKKQNYVEMESGIPPHPAMFEANRMTPLFPLPPARSPPFPANLFGSGPHQGASMSKNSELGSPFNQLFPQARPQNGLGFQFNNFGMNSVHGAMSNSPQITPHSGSVTVTPHMSNFTFTNIFSDVNNSSQNDALNISPIKFPHPNPMLPPQGMDPNSLHHPHQQGSSIYHHHNRAHPSSVIHNAMNINSILGHNHHSFDSRGMSQGINTSVAPPFPGHGHPPGFGMPPLNFSMHDT